MPLLYFLWQSADSHFVQLEAVLTAGLMWEQCSWSCWFHEARISRSLPNPQHSACSASHGFQRLCWICSPCKCPSSSWLSKAIPCWALVENKIIVNHCSSMLCSAIKWQFCHRTHFQGSVCLYWCFKVFLLNITKVSSVCSCGWGGYFISKVMIVMVSVL